MSTPSHAPRVSSREAAAQHARLLAAGPPKDHHLVVPAFALALAGAAAALTVAPVVAAFLAALAACLLAAVLGERRGTWRYADTARPARLRVRRVGVPAAAAVAVPSPRAAGAAPAPRHQVPTA